MPTLHGNTTGLAPAATRTLERIYRRRVPFAEIATAELVRSLADASRETGRQVGALVHRSGDVESVVVGDATKLFLPDVGRLRAAQGRLRGLRLIHTHLFGEGLTRDDIVDLVRLRLDLVAAIQLHGGEPKTLSYAYNTPVSDAAPAEARLPYREMPPVLLGRLDLDFGALVAALEEEFARQARTRRTESKEGRAILVHVADKNKRRTVLSGRSVGLQEEAEESLRELEELARSAGLQVEGTVLQLRDGIDAKTLIGKGKLDDLVLMAAERDAETLVFDSDLGPSQAAAVSKHTELKVVDRSQLILDIFAHRAESADGKLQVELAQLKYTLPRLGLKDDSLSRLTGGIGGRGPGETKLEIGRRRAKERVSFLEAELKKLAKQREQRRRKRRRTEVPVVSIVGYTNAGKSTLLNALTESNVLVEDKLFATLDTRSRRLRFPEEREVIVTDTVGFIRRLPEGLFAAFRATFEETSDADMLLHVVDASDPSRDQHIATTEELLAELQLLQIPRVVVMNKIDRLSTEDRRVLRLAHQAAIFVSAVDRASLEPLLALLATRLASRWLEARVRRDAPSGPEPREEPEEQTGDAHELTTLEELAGRRARPARTRR